MAGELAWQGPLAQRCRRDGGEAYAQITLFFFLFTGIVAPPVTAFRASSESCPSAAGLSAPVGFAAGVFDGVFDFFFAFMAVILGWFQSSFVRSQDLHFHQMEHPSQDRIPGDQR
jgi:hypothetical protein